MSLQCTQKGADWLVSFQAMASPCEVLFDLAEHSQAQWLGELARDEALRIEKKFSRYRTDNMTHTINNSRGRPVTVDPETAGLLDFAGHLFGISNGRFDITSGVLRRLWTFDGGGRIPSRKQAKALLPLVGWDRLTWENPVISVPEGMEIDLGGMAFRMDQQTFMAVVKNLDRFSRHLS